MKKRVVWKKWIDPLSPEDSKPENQHVIELDEEEERPYQDSYDILDRKLAQMDDKKNNSPTGPLIISPMGVIPLNEHNIPSKVFNFWMGHTNFDIGEEEAEIINSAIGVETLDIYTRYRFRIAIGRAFDEDEVLHNLQTILCKCKQEKELDNPAPLVKLKEHLKSNYAFWAIFQLDDGQLDYMTGDTKESVTEKIQQYPQKAHIMTSWEMNNGVNKKENKQ